MRPPQRPVPAAHEPGTEYSTHEIDVQGEVVTKRYRSWSRREPHREWAALTLLAEHAPGLSPIPISADLDGVPPAVTMSRLPGTPLRGLQAGPHVVEAMATALTRLHRDVPARDGLEPAAWNPDSALALIQSQAAEKLALGWLLILGPGGPSAARNPPGTLERQAGRVLALLNS